MVTVKVKIQLNSSLVDCASTSASTFPVQKIMNMNFYTAGLAWINPPGFYPSGFIRINPPNFIHLYPEKIKNKGKMHKD